VFLGKTPYSHSVTLHPGVSMGMDEFNAEFNDRLIASHPGGSRNTPSHFMLQKLDIRAGLISHLVCIQTFCFLPHI